ncbi:MAG: isochorismatase family protein [Vampirovibrio sp.]|nr:isochorismatase family protein [Vampirovibrio sp.]
MVGRLLNLDQSLLLIVDVQEKFMPVVNRSEQFISQCRRMTQGAAALQLPVLVSEQYPKGLGHTVPELANDLPPGTPIMEKTAFGCLQDTAIRDKINSLNRNQIMLIGLETHVCINQTAHQLLEAGYQVHLLEDAITSRTQENHNIGLVKMRQSGIITSCVEAALFELMETATHPAFKTIQGLVK